MNETNTTTNQKNKLVPIIIAVIVGIAGLGLVFLVTQNNAENASDELSGSENDLTNSSNVMGDSSVADNSGNENQGNNSQNESSLAIPNGAALYVVSDGTEVSYTAQKRFLQKEDDAVVGVSATVSGNGYLDLENNVGGLEISTDFDDLVSDSPKRDEDILALFNDTAVKLKADNIRELGFDYNEPFSINVPAELTINGVTKDVVFVVEGVATENAVTAEGKTMIKMSDFGINPPSLINVYTVDDEIEIAFKLNAVSTQ